MKGRIYMNEKELDRVEIFKRVVDGRMKRSKAPKILGLSDRQIKRIEKRFNSEGVKGLVSKKMGKKCFSWIEKHPQLREKNLQVVCGG